MLVFLFMAFRQDFTPDYWAYEAVFNSIHANGFDDKLYSEIGYQFLNIILPSYRMVIVVVTLLYCSGIYIIFKTFIPSRYWSLAFIFVFIDPFAFLIPISAIRNTVALAAFLWGVYFLSKKQKIPYIILILLGSLFHASILVFIPLIFFSPSRVHSNALVLTLFFAVYVILSAVTPRIWWDSVMLLISQTDSLSRYSSYVGEVLGTSRGLSYLLLFFMIFFNLKALSVQNLAPNEYLCLKLALLWFIVVFSPSVGMTSRYFIYVDLLLFAAVPVVMQHMNSRLLKYTYASGVFLYFGVQLSIFVSGSTFNDFYLVYKTVLFG